MKGCCSFAAPPWTGLKCRPKLPPQKHESDVNLGDDNDNDNDNDYATMLHEYDDAMEADEGDEVVEEKLEANEEEVKEGDSSIVDHLDKPSKIDVAFF